MSEHLPDECTYDDPNGDEVLAFRDERHVVLPADEYRTLLDVVEAARGCLGDDTQTAMQAQCEDALRLLDRLRS